MPQNRSKSDGFYEAIADAVSDIREKVVEEPWYGRAVTDRETAPECAQAHETAQWFGSSVRTRETMEPNRDPEPELGLDR